MDENVTWWYSKNNERFGPIAESEIKVLIETGTINDNTLVWNNSMEDWLNYRSSSLAKYIITPPPLPALKVNNLFAWNLALAPIYVIVINYAISSIFGRDVAIMMNWFVSYILTLSIWFVDRSVLRKIGKESGYWKYWIMIATPIYLFIRSHKTDKNYLYSVLSLVLFLVLLALSLLT